MKNVLALQKLNSRTNRNGGGAGPQGSNLSVTLCKCKPHDSCLSVVQCGK